MLIGASEKRTSTTVRLAEYRSTTAAAAPPPDSNHQPVRALNTRVRNSRQESVWQLCGTVCNNAKIVIDRYVSICLSIHPHERYGPQLGVRRAAREESQSSGYCDMQTTATVAGTWIGDHQPRVALINGEISKREGARGKLRNFPNPLTDNGWKFFRCRQT